MNVSRPDRPTDPGWLAYWLASWMLKTGAGPWTLTRETQAMATSSLPAQTRSVHEWDKLLPVRNQTMVVLEWCKSRSSPCVSISPRVSASILPLLNLTAALGGDAHLMTDGPVSQSSQRCAWEPLDDWWSVCHLLVLMKQLINWTLALISTSLQESTTNRQTN